MNLIYPSPLRSLTPTLAFAITSTLGISRSKAALVIQEMARIMSMAESKAPRAKKTATIKDPDRDPPKTTSTSTSEGGVKRERSSTPQSNTTTTPTVKRPKTTTSQSKIKSEGDHPSPGKSAPRLPGSAKQKIAEEIIAIGAGGLNVEKMAAATGLTVQQVRSQLVANRSNLRRQLMDFAKGL